MTGERTAIPKVRGATVGDRTALLEINAAGAPGVTPLDDAELAELGSQASLWLVAEVDGRIAGYLIAFAPDDPGEGEELLWFRAHVPRCLYVDQVAVHPDLRRRGVASVLYRAVFSEASDRGVGIVACEINLEPPNPDSLAFHRRLGFGEVGRLRVSDGRLVSLQARENVRTPVRSLT